MKQGKVRHFHQKKTKKIAFNVSFSLKAMAVP
jgi:hypothetical protein